MSSILCVTSGLMGITNASLELLRRLKNDGNIVTYASPRDRTNYVNEHGFDFVKLDEIREDPSPPLPKMAKWRRPVYKWRNARTRKRKAIANLEPSRYDALLKKENFDLLIIDMELHEYVISALTKGHKVLLLSQWFSIWRAVGLPYILTDAIPGKGFSGSKLGMNSKWTQVKWMRQWVFFKRKMISGGTNRSETIRSYAQREGFPNRYIGNNYWPGPFLWQELSVISMTDEGLEFPHKRRKGLYYAGPLVMEYRKEEVSDRLRKFVEDGDRKLVYCSFSTLSAGDENFIHKVVQCGENHPEWNFVISLGGKQAMEKFKTDSKNVLIFGRVAQMYVLRHADCSLNHGGIHTINECLVNRVPMVVYSGKRSDQNGCAARVHYHGVGIMGDKDVDDAKAIGEKISEVLSDKRFREKCGEYQRGVIDLKNNKTVEKFINEYIKR